MDDLSKRDAMNTATRVMAGDNRTHYDPFAMSLHWATVFLVLANFALAETWELFARPTRHAMIVTHMSFGILLAAVVIARIAWRLIPGHQMPPAVSGWSKSRRRRCIGCSILFWRHRRRSGSCCAGREGKP